MHPALEVIRAHGRVPSRVWPTPGADLGDDHKVVGIGMQRLTDELVGHMGPVEVAGVDVVDAARDRLAQHRDRGIVVLRRPEHARSGELAGALAKALHNPVAEWKRARGSDVVHGCVSFFSSTWERRGGGPERLLGFRTCCDSVAGSVCWVKHMPDVRGGPGGKTTTELQRCRESGCI